MCNGFDGVTMLCFTAFSSNSCNDNGTTLLSELLAFSGTSKMMLSSKRIFNKLMYVLANLNSSSTVTNSLFFCSKTYRYTFDNPDVNFCA